MSLFNLDTLGRVLGTDAGRSFVYELLGACKLFHQPYVPGNPEHTAFNSGGLNIGLALYESCNLVSPELTAIMMKEGTNVPATRADTSGSGARPVATSADDSQPVLRPDPRSASGFSLGFDRFGFGGTGPGAATDLGQA